MRTVGVLCVAATILSCSHFSGVVFPDYDPQAERSGRIGLTWHRRMADYTEVDWRPVFHGTPAADPRTGWLYVGSVDRGLYAVRTQDGAVVWRFETLGRVDSTPVIDGDRVVFGDADGALYSLDAQTGRLQWRYATTAAVIHAPTVADGSVYFDNANDVVFALNRDNGQVRWRYRRNPVGGISLSGHAGIAKLGRHIYAGFSDGNVVCLDAADGSVAWEQDTSIDIENIEARNEAHDPIDVDTTPVILGETVFVASFTAGVYGLDVLSGNRRWRRSDVLHVAGLGTDGRYLYAASALSGLVKIDPFDGSVIWARDVGSNAIAGAASMGDNMLAVPMADRGLWFVRASDGTVTDGILPGGGFLAVPTRMGDQMFVESNSGELYALRLASVGTPNRSSR